MFMHLGWHLAAAPAWSVPGGTQTVSGGRPGRLVDSPPSAVETVPLHQNVRLVRLPLEAPAPSTAPPSTAPPPAAPPVPVPIPAPEPPLPVPPVVPPVVQPAASDTMTTASPAFLLNRLPIIAIPPKV